MIAAVIAGWEDDESQGHMRQRQARLCRERKQLFDHVQTLFVGHRFREEFRPKRVRLLLPLAVFAREHTLGQGLHAVTPMPNRWQTGSISRSIERLRME